MHSVCQESTYLHSENKGLLIRCLTGGAIVMRVSFKQSDRADGPGLAAVKHDSRPNIL